MIPRMYFEKTSLAAARPEICLKCNELEICRKKKSNPTHNPKKEADETQNQQQVSHCRTQQDSGKQDTQPQNLEIFMTTYFRMKRYR